MNTASVFSRFCRKRILFLWSLSAFLYHGPFAMAQAQKENKNLSLFFTAQELQNRSSAQTPNGAIEKDPDHGHKEATPMGQQDTPSSFYCAAFFYLSEKEWTIWMNDQKLTESHPCAVFGSVELCVTHITEKGVDLSWTYGQKTHRCTVRTNQSCTLSSGHVKNRVDSASTSLQKETS